MFEGFRHLRVPTKETEKVEAMESLGFRAFGVAGHDRGGRVAYRMALDWPERVAKLAVLDIVPTYEQLWRSIGCRRSAATTGTSWPSPATSQSD